MKAHEPQDFVKICEDRKATAFKDFSTTVISVEAHKKFAPTLRRLSFFYDCTLYAFSGSVHFDVRVMEMKEIEPALRLFEDELAVEFDKTDDYAGEQFAQRKFTTKCGKIVVNASIHGDTPTCRSVKIGEKLVPEYKLVCDDDAAPAGGKTPADDIPF